jgi:hypothetical protein
MSSGGGLATEFRSEKIPRNRLGMVSFIPRKKVLIPRHSKFYGRVNSEARHGRKWDEKNKFYKILLQQPQCFHLFSSETASEENSESLSLFLSYGTEFRVVFSSGVQNRFMRVCFYFCSMAQNSEHFSPLRNGSERNSESFLFR